ncbi:MAG TPA: hypothetical protein VET88_13350 [Gammaproteobacteria bacterium]|nr:hypothetical protein [Gammaproteobacteria bacterium]
MNTETRTCYRPLALVLLSVAVLVMVVSYIGICVHTGNWWPWNEIVHEGGDLSLLWTMLYFEHASRELPLDLLLGIAVGCSIYYLCPGPDAPVSGYTHHRRRLAVSGLLAFLAVSAIICGTLWKNGFEALVNNLLQMHTRPGAELVWGAHWRYHLLSRLSLMLASLGFAGMLLYLDSGKSASGDRSGMYAFGLVLAVFAGISLVFAPDIDPFRDPVFLGHQVREVFSHALVTLPAAWGICLLYAGRSDRAQSAITAGRAGLFWPAVSLLTAIILGSWLLAGALMTSAASQGQTEHMTMLIFPHFFEHSFTFLVVPAIALMSYEILALRGYRRGV